MKKIINLLILLTFILCIDKINAYTEYKIGDEVRYNNIDYYVIKNSSSADDTVTLLKAEPLTVDEVNLYGGVGTENNHVNMFNTSLNDSYYRKASNQNGYGSMAYYSSVNCGYGVDSNNTYLGCTIDYVQSEVKYIVDAWAAVKVPSGLCLARLITMDELEDNLGYELHKFCTESCYIVGEKTLDTPNWVYGNYWYWTMTQYKDSASAVWGVGGDGSLSFGIIYNHALIRPVIVLNKASLGDADESNIQNNTEDKNVSIVDSDTEQQNKNDITNDSKETKTMVKVANTYMSKSIIIIILGFIIASISVYVLYKLSNKKKNI